MENNHNIPDQIYSPSFLTVSVSTEYLYTFSQPDNFNVWYSGTGERPFHYHVAPPRSIDRSNQINCVSIERSNNFPWWLTATCPPHKFRVLTGQYRV